MLRNAFRTTLMAAAFVTAASVALAQAAQNQTGMALHAKTILGAQVSVQGGTNVGTVQDIVLNDDGVVEYLIVSEGGKLVTVPWEAAKFGNDRRTININITQEKFRQIPTYTVERYPDFYTPAYRVQVYRYYGLTPGRERRLERREERRP
jgi:sporulation protein YlmC with PRC-barrel domain